MELVLSDLLEEYPDTITVVCIYNWICLFFLYSLQLSSFFFFFRFAMTFLWRRSDWMGYCIVRTTLPSRSYILFLSYILTPFRSCNMMVSWCIYLIAMIIRKNALLIYNTLIRYCCGHWSSHFFFMMIGNFASKSIKMCKYLDHGFSGD